MQLYHGLPIITNKITQDEMKGVPHHLLGCIELEEETWTVGKFVGRALNVVRTSTPPQGKYAKTTQIDEIRSRGKLPILVGGTHYYTQSLLFQDALADEPALDIEENREKFPILDETTEVILAKLREVDPIMADRWHPNERRKIQRSLEIYLRTGKCASQVYDEQRLKRETLSNTSDGELHGQTRSSQSLRFPTLLLWVHASKDVLNPRLDARIGKMLDRGLLSEVKTLTDFRMSYEARTSNTIDQSRGIWVSIGYKEFLSYQAALNDRSGVEAEVETIKKTAIEKTQAATRQYANRQIRWIRIKLLNALFSADQKNNVFLLDGTDLSKWEEQVIQPANNLTERFLSGDPLPNPLSLSSAASEMLTPKRNYDLGQRPDLWQKTVCKTCGTVAVTENDWNLHVKSRAHRRAVGARKKQENAKDSPKRDKKELQEDIVDILEMHIEDFPHEGSPR